jgi:hypothetical protein
MNFIAFMENWGERDGSPVLKGLAQQPLPWLAIERHVIASAFIV